MIDSVFAILAVQETTMSDDSFDFSDLIAEEVGEAAPSTAESASPLQAMAARIEQAENAFQILSVN